MAPTQNPDSLPFGANCPWYTGYVGGKLRHAYEVASSEFAPQSWPSVPALVMMKSSLTRVLLACRRLILRPWYSDGGTTPQPLAFWMKSGPLPWLSIRFEMFVQGIVLLLQTMVSAGLKLGVLAEAAVAPASPRVLTATN